MNVPGFSRTAQSHKHEFGTEAGNRALRESLQVGNHRGHALIYDLLGRGPQHRALEQRQCCKHVSK